MLAHYEEGLVSYAYPDEYRVLFPGGGKSTRWVKAEEDSHQSLIKSVNDLSWFLVLCFLLRSLRAALLQDDLGFVQ